MIRKEALIEKLMEILIENIGKTIVNRPLLNSSNNEIKKT